MFLLVTLTLSIIILIGTADGPGDRSWDWSRFKDARRVRYWVTVCGGMALLGTILSKLSV